MSIGRQQVTTETLNLFSSTYNHIPWVCTTATSCNHNKADEDIVRQMDQALLFILDAHQRPNLFLYSVVLQVRLRHVASCCEACLDQVVSEQLRGAELRRLSARKPEGNQ